ncbi:uncharacterized protein LOC110241910 [Exaiptasia diaphana]|uniref:Spermatogenesis-associated protein 6 N-terminal domain-containing protein n=1 Tax=Exaiptasia diaphana TaxID=2652724 RepID=A0A913XFP4_EXADI|nr:uncharacterized protein LOC110241910 [Exaiptasia diaphana]KXJ12580.1 Spermatogenesis-associated protein 6 [Exaiptasia diaphana]
MPRKAFSCTIDLDIYRVTCPGTLHLHDRNMVFINAFLLGQTGRTKSVFATFPLNFNERFVFEKTFTTVSEPSQVVEILEDEFIVLELRQYSEYHKGGKLLGRYKQTAKEFLYPTPTLTGKTGMDRELLLSRTVHFNGIDPKLDFASRTTIQEVTIPGVQGFPEANGYSSDVSEESISDERSGTEEEVVIHPTSYTSDYSDVHCVCECPRRPENKGVVVSRSRSLSPTRRPRSASPVRQPPFRAGTADRGIISRRDFSHSKKSRNRTPLPAEGDPLPCYNCKTPHKDCIVCQAYYKVFGRDFLKHRFTTNTHLPTRASEPPPRRTRRYFEQDTGPSYHERAYSAPIPRLKTRLFSTPNVRSSSPKRENRTTYLSDSDDDSLLSLQELRSEINSARLESLDRSFEDPSHPALGTRLDRSLRRY